MKRILLIGKINDAVKDIEKILGTCFHVQICPFNLDSFTDMMRVVTPDMFLISLVGAYEYQSGVLNVIRSSYSNIPVITIGTEFEKNKFLRYYKMPQFENLIRPVDNKTILEAVCRRTGCIYTTREDGTYEIKEIRIRKMVLVVDDNATTLRTIKEMLQDEYDVTVANSGMKALTQMGKNCPDLILLDYEMPICDGKQTLEMISCCKQIHHCSL